MGNKAGNNNSVVKIDSTLLEKINKFIEKEENRLKFVNKKQFVDIAVFELLKKMEVGK